VLALNSAPHLKGHVNEADFLGFGIGPLHYVSSLSDFSFEFSEIFYYEYLREFEAKIGTARKVV
jgi:hypothetical protein